ncbi:MAG: hypothetical protein U0326_21445 [Polyangiales bacterium]
MKDMLKSWQERNSLIHRDATEKSEREGTGSTDIVKRSLKTALAVEAEQSTARGSSATTERRKFFCDSNATTTRGANSLVDSIKANKGCSCGGDCGSRRTDSNTPPVRRNQALDFAVLLDSKHDLTARLQDNEQILSMVWSNTIGHTATNTLVSKLARVGNYTSHLPDRERMIAVKLIESVTNAEGSAGGTSVWDRIGHGISYDGSDTCGAITAAADDVWNLIFDGLEGNGTWLGFASWYRQCDRIDNPDPCVALGEAYAHCSPDDCADAYNAHQHCIQQWGERTQELQALGRAEVRRLCRAQAIEEARRYGVPASLFPALDAAATLDDLAMLCAEATGRSWPQNRGPCVLEGYSVAVSYGLFLLFLYGLTGTEDAVYLALTQTAQMASRVISACLNAPQDSAPSSRPRPSVLRIHH